MAYDSSKPVTGGSLVAADVRENFRALKEDGIVICSSTFEYVKVSDVKAYNIDGGTFTSGSMQTRVINTEDSDTSSICSIASNQITLAAGTYLCNIICPAFWVNRHIAQLYNITDSATTLLGMSQFADANYGGVTLAFIVGKFIITAQKIFEIQHRCQSTRADEGFGIAHGFSGINNVYTIAEFWRVS
ncbi:MAG: hypothetical protein KAU20_05885 [Nanoarchaeota archaeon]|nr:hypothetical protein [Nanoarchaeota archaeon]